MPKPKRIGNVEMRIEIANRAATSVSKFLGVSVLEAFFGLVLGSVVSAEVLDHYRSRCFAGNSEIVSMKPFLSEF